MPPSDSILLSPSAEAESFNPFGSIRTPKPDSHGEPDWNDAAELLNLIMPVLQVVIWESWLEPLELISLRFGKGARSALGLEPAQMQPGARWVENVYPSDRERLLAFLGREPATKIPPSIDYRLIVGEGEFLWVRHWNFHRSVDAGKRTRLQGLIMAISEQKNLESQCLRISERECNRIGQELHDDLCQVLTGLGFMMKVLAQRAAKHSGELGAELTSLNTQVSAATERVRSMAHGLFPAQLNYRTLRQALREFVLQIRARFPVRLRLKLQPKLPPHRPEQIIHIYRIVQEAVSNSLRHGNATEIKIAVHAAHQKVQVSIEDNGKGFPVPAGRPEGIGLHVMNYRARVLGGSFRVKKRTPQGATVEVEYPVAAVSRPRDRGTPARAK